MVDLRLGDGPRRHHPVPCQGPAGRPRGACRQVRAPSGLRGDDVLVGYAEARAEMVLGSVPLRHGAGPGVSSAIRTRAIHGMARRGRQPGGRRHRVDTRRVAVRTSVASPGPTIWQLTQSAPLEDMLRFQGRLCPKDQGPGRSPNRPPRAPSANS